MLNVILKANSLCAHGSLLSCLLLRLAHRVWLIWEWRPCFSVGLSAVSRFQLRRVVQVSHKSVSHLSVTKKSVLNHNNNYKSTSIYFRNARSTENLPGFHSVRSSCFPTSFRRLVVGFAFMVPDVTFNEAYISFIFTHPDWRRAGIATFMLYHLIQVAINSLINSLTCYNQ